MPSSHRAFVVALVILAGGTRSISASDTSGSSPEASDSASRLGSYPLISRVQPQGCPVSEGRLLGWLGAGA